MQLVEPHRLADARPLSVFLVDLIELPITSGIKQ
jgi:hypothetical protein